MLSRRQNEANRRNAGKSSDLKTETGKAAARYNAVQHGFAGDHLVLSVEDRPAFEKLRGELLDEYQPGTPTEAFQIERMFAALWHLRRIRAAEAAHLDSEMSCFLKGGDPEKGPSDAAQRLISQRPKPVPPQPNPTKINEKPKIGFVPQKPVAQVSARPSTPTPPLDGTAL